MNQPAKQDPADSEDTFESVLAQLCEQIRRSKWVNSELDRIVTNGLEVAKKTDTIYSDEGTFTQFRLYLLYKVVFEVWSYQHQALLELLKANKQQQFQNNSQLVFQHHNVMINTFHDLNQLANVNDAHSLRGSWLLVWKQTISYLAGFVNIPKVDPVKPNNKTFGGFFSRLTAISQKTTYPILATCALVLGLLIGFFLLINK